MIQTIVELTDGAVDFLIGFGDSIWPKEPKARKNPQPGPC